MAREPKGSVRDRIIAAAEDLFWRYGIRKVTVDEIALAADVGKGTVYLHFDSKEEIAVEIISKYKEAVLEEQIELAQDAAIPVIERLKKVVTLPVAASHERANKSPMVVELITAVRPHLMGRFTEMMEREVQAIGGILEEANAAGSMHVENVATVARQIKIISLAYMPGSIVCTAVDDPVRELGNTVDLIYKGLQ
jgi:AcrR family transcriptional regulator